MHIESEKTYYAGEQKQEGANKAPEHPHEFRGSEFFRIDRHARESEEETEELKGETPNK